MSDIRQYLTDVALVGYAYSGKSTFAKFLVESFQYKRLFFAEPIKHQITEKFITDNFGINVTKSIKRRVYRLLGDWARSVIDNDVYVKLLESKFLAEPGLVVIDDVRYPNEFEWCKKNRFTMIGVYCPLEKLAERAGKENEDFAELFNHSSERYIDELMPKCDIIISGVEDPIVEFEKIIKYWKGER